MMPLRGGLAPLTLPSKFASGNGLLNNLVAYWALDEAGGANNALDKHSNGLTVGQVSSPGSAAGLVYASARTFDGSGDLFTRASATALQTGDVDFTLAAWVWIGTKGAYNHIAAKWAVSVQEYLIRYQGGATDRYYFEVRNAANSAYVNVTATSFGVPPTSQWTLVVASHDATANQIQIQVNNGAIDTTTLVGGINSSTQPFNIGSQIATATLTWNGRLGPISMWKSAAGAGGVLTAAQRTALYAAGAGLAYSAFTL